MQPAVDADGGRDGVLERQDADEQRIVNSSRYDLHIAQRVPYHFAGNMNGLAALAGGEVLMLANDDLARPELCGRRSTALNRKTIGLVEAPLRDQHGL